MAVRLSALRTGRCFLSKPQGLVRPEGLGKLIKIIHHTGSRTRDLRFVTQLLNHYKLRNISTDPVRTELFSY
jgi:hypothetical protein